MKTTNHTANLHYTRQELNALLGIANAEDVEKGGRYDVRGGAINVWSHHWVHPATRDEFEMLGSFYVNWMAEMIWRIDCDEGFALDDLLHELAMLEQKSVGYTKHGRLLKL